MEKGKFGFKLSLYAVLAFVFAMLGNLTALMLLAGAVIFVEKNEWASRQVIQAIVLSLFSSVVHVGFSLLGFFDWFGWAGYDTSLYNIYSGWSKFGSIVYYLVDIAVYILGFVAIMNTAKGKEAAVPIAEKFANWAYGRITAAAQTETKAQTAKVCASCGSPLDGGAFCSKCGAPTAKKD